MDCDNDTDRACRAHGISLRLRADSDDTSSDSGRSDFDDAYRRHMPDPFPLSQLEHRIVLVPPDQMTPRTSKETDDEPRIEDTLEHVPNTRVGNQFAVLNLDDDDSGQEDDEEEEDGTSESEATYERVVGIEDFEMAGGVREEEWRTHVGRKRRRTANDSKSALRDVYQRLALMRCSDDGVSSSDEAPNCDSSGGDPQTRLLISNLRVKTIKTGCATSKKRGNVKRGVDKCKVGDAEKCKAAEVVETSEDAKAAMAPRRKTGKATGDSGRLLRSKKKEAREAARPEAIEAAGNSFFEKVKAWVTLVDAIVDRMVAMRWGMVAYEPDAHPSRLYILAMVNVGQSPLLMGQVDDLFEDMHSNPDVAFANKRQSKPSVSQVAWALFHVQKYIREVFRLFRKSAETADDAQSELQIAKTLEATAAKLQSTTSHLRLLLKDVKDRPPPLRCQTAKIADDGTQDLLLLMFADQTVEYERELAKIECKMKTTISRKYQKRMLLLHDDKSMHYLYLQAQYVAAVRDLVAISSESGGGGDDSRRPAAKTKKRKKNKKSRATDDRTSPATAAPTPAPSVPPTITLFSGEFPLLGHKPAAEKPSETRTPPPEPARNADRTDSSGGGSSRADDARGEAPSEGGTRARAARRDDDDVAFDRTDSTGGGSSLADDARGEAPPDDEPPSEGGTRQDDDDDDVAFDRADELSESGGGVARDCSEMHTGKLFYPFGTASELFGTTRQPRGRARGADWPLSSLCRRAQRPESQFSVWEDCASGKVALRYFELSPWRAGYGPPAKFVCARCGRAVGLGADHACDAVPSTSSSRCRLF